MSKIPLWIFENLHEIIRDLETNYILIYTDHAVEETEMERIIQRLKNCKEDLHRFEETYSKDS